MKGAAMDNFVIDAEGEDGSYWLEVSRSETKGTIKIEILQPDSGSVFIEVNAAELHRWLSGVVSSDASLPCAGLLAQAAREDAH